MEEYMKKRRASADFRKRESKFHAKVQNIETIREKKKQTVTRRKVTNPEHEREIDKKSKRKWKTAENPNHIEEIAKKSSRRQKVKNPEQVWCQGGPKALLKQLLLTLISSYKIADHSELISHTLATGLWRLL